MVDNDSEGEDHFRLKQSTHNYIYENFYMNNNCKILVTTELEQIHNPFTSHLESDKEIIYYTLDGNITETSKYIQTLLLPRLLYSTSPILFIQGD